MNEYVRAFFRSPLAIAVLSATTLAAAAAVLTGLMPITIVVPLYVGITGGAIAFILSSKTGARAILKEQDRARNERDAMILEDIACIRKQLSMVRLEREDLRRTIEKIVLAAGMYLESCAEGNPRDPFIEEAIRHAEHMLRSYLRLNDARAVHRVLNDVNAASNSPESLESGEPAIMKSLTESLEKTAREIGERLALPEGGLEKSRARLDQLNADRELEE
ncbi:MAG: hypothetical protein N3A02_07315 [Rectinema sp.]|nr:hypothetical protein [Rectinema sp.]